jgi:hypothetical protein
MDTEGNRCPLRIRRYDIGYSSTDTAGQKGNKGIESKSNKANSYITKIQIPLPGVGILTTNVKTATTAVNTAIVAIPNELCILEFFIEKPPIHDLNNRHTIANIRTMSKDDPKACR